MKLYDTNYPYSFNYTISNLLSSSFCSEKELYDIYLTYLKTIQTKEEEIDKNNKKIIDIFIGYISKIQSQEAYFLIDKMINLNLADKNITKKINTRYFAHYKIRPSYKIQRYGVTERYFYVNYDKLSKNDWELHKKYIEEGVNPNEIAKIIRNDELEKLQKVSSHEKFDFNQTIEPSLYERCSFINHYVTLIDYAAFFSSVKCFKYLLMNGAKINNTGKYAIAGGNIEIIHLCEQNHSSFKDAYKTAIQFHKNDIFKYLYENKVIEMNKNYFLEKLGKKCIKSVNYEILAFLIDNGMKISNDIINEAAKIGNLYLVRHFLQNNQLPEKILIKSIKKGNYELVKFILEQKRIDVNVRNVYFLYIDFVLIVLDFIIIFGNYLNYLELHFMSHLKMVIQK